MVTTTDIEQREMVGGGKPKARGRPRKHAGVDAALVEIQRTLASIVAENRRLTDEIERIKVMPQRLPTTAGPEKELASFIKGMRPGEQRDGVKAVYDTDVQAMEGALQCGDIVAIKPDTQKGSAWRKNLKSDEPIYGTVLQYLGRTQRKRGPRKYIVHFKGIGGDGVTEEEIEFVKSAS